MNNIAQKLEYIKWLKSIGIEYYFSSKKDSDISFINELKHHYNKLPGIGSEEIMIKKSTNSPTPVKTTTINNINGDKEILSIKEARVLADSVNSLSKLKEVVVNFNGCGLKNFALNTVFADGNPEAKIMLIGEAPGAKEDEFGIPFCGESGMLLDTMLSTVKLSRKENIYITNTVFWRPPANRKPTKQEINICQPFLEKHIALVALPFPAYLVKKLVLIPRETLSIFTKIATYPNQLPLWLFSIRLIFLGNLLKRKTLGLT